ncbi:type I restriction enzyme S subunit [Elizabethkingia sp. YR214]|uniref:restriction endonuclease subunit S n=1 Tax=Elizabethkingia sp. YR214 TaxID=2135667 RepID=UPI000D309AB8|nr:restriction endonuclease subunit S [Elizabethkingia sp. YR214]PUB29443.1 type I restriction enzyme S subunit [Elizabethkingia sp. YR214]
MQVAEKKYLKYIDYLQLDNWSVQSLLDPAFNYSNKFSLSRIGDFLIKSRSIINIDDHIIYKRITVRINNNGVFLRDKEKGVSIGTKRQYLTKSGQFIVSKIDARNGAFGIIPKELDGAIVTNDFPLYDVDTTKIDPRFLLLITTTKEFINFAQSCSSGTTNRQRMDIDMFLNQRIPLPSLVEQEKIVKNYYNKIEEAEKLNQKANNLEREIEQYLFEELGIQKDIVPKTKNKSIMFVDFFKITKWGLDFIGKSINKKQLYKEFSIDQLCKIGSGGTPSRTRKYFYIGGNIPWIKTGELNNAVLFDTEEKITEEAVKNSSAKLYKKGSLVIAMYGATIGKTAKLGIDSATNQACAVLFDIDNTLVLTDFLWEYLQSQTDNLKKLAYGSAQPNLNAGIIKSYLIPIPPISKQEEIINEISEIKNKKLVSETEAKKLLIEAQQEFEQTIFS